MRNFESDNTSGASPEILDAVARVNAGSAASYGADEVTAGLAARFADVFEHDVTVFPVATGTAANALSLASLCPPYGVIYCHREAHVSVHECGAPEFYTGGAKLGLLDGAAGKITPEALAEALAAVWRGSEHMTQPAALSLTQASEFGAVYTVDELAALCDFAHAQGLRVHMDGARFANALAHLGCAPADITWRAGIDVLSFGATKNGAMAAEAVVFFDPELADGFLYRRKRGGHLISKMRFLSVQLEAYLEDGLWLRNAARANALAARLAAGLAALPGVTLDAPVEANMIFAWLPAALVEALVADGFRFHVMGADGARQRVRLVVSFNTEEAAVDAFLAALGRHAGGAQAAG